MATKLQAADVARRAGVDVVIATGQIPEVIGRLAAGERVGTLFPALASPWKGARAGSWQAPSRRSAGGSGAVAAMQEKGSSLLPKGIVAVKGDFVRGDVVRILDPKGSELARGICRYDHLELDRLRGVHSDQIEQVLGYGYGAVAIHRDDMVLL